MSDFNLDTVDEKGYQPVTVTYRGEDYTVGTTAYGLMRVPAVVDFDGKENAEVGAELIKKLPELLELLSPELAEALDEPTLPEQLLLIEAMTEVLNRLGKFQATASEE